MVPLGSNGRHMEAGPVCPRKNPFAYSLSHDKLNYYHICLIFFESPILSPFFFCLCNLHLFSVSLWEIAAQEGAQNTACLYLSMRPSMRTDMKPKSECLLEGKASAPVCTLQGDPRCVPTGACQFQGGVNTIWKSALQASPVLYAMNHVWKAPFPSYLIQGVFPVDGINPPLKLKENRRKCKCQSNEKLFFSLLAMLGFELRAWYARAILRFCWSLFILGIICFWLFFLNVFSWKANKTFI